MDIIHEPLPVRTDTLLSFDLETTGLNPNTEHIVTSSLVTMFADGSFADNRRIADPGIPIHPKATEVHGYTNEQATAEGEPHEDVLAWTVNTLYQAWGAGCPVVVFNAAYDLSMLAALDPSFEIRGPVVDPMVLDKILDPWRKGPRRLVPTAEHYGFTFTEEQAHDSSADAVASGRIAHRLLTEVMPADQRPIRNLNREFADLQGVDFTVADAAADAHLLMALQTTCRRAGQDSFRSYLQRKGKPTDDVDGGWPIQDATHALNAARAEA